MKKLMSTRYSAGVFNVAMLLMRVVFGGMMIHYGYQKLTHFNEMVKMSTPMFGMSPTTVMALLVFAEFFCAMFIILGLFTRLAAIPLVISFSVALFKAHHADVFGDGEKAALYLGAFLIILLLGPGKASVDGLAGK